MALGPFETAAVEPRFDPIELDSSWRFRPGDEIRWSSPDFDDSSWPTVDITRSWADQGFKAVEWGWYRTTVRPIPDQLAGTDGHLGLWLGEVVSSYRVYAGGIEIGGNGRFPPLTDIEHDRRRILPIPPEAVRDGSLTIAIQVYRHPAWHGRDGGLSGPPPRLGRLDDLAFDHASSQVPMIVLVALALILAVYLTTVSFQLQSPKAARGLALVLVLAAAAGFLQSQYRFLLSDGFMPLKKAELSFYGLWAMAWARWLCRDVAAGLPGRWGRWWWIYPLPLVLWIVWLWSGDPAALGRQSAVGLWATVPSIAALYWVWRPPSEIGKCLRWALALGALLLVIHGLGWGPAAWAVPAVPLVAGVAWICDRETVAKTRRLQLDQLRQSMGDELAGRTEKLTHALEEARSLSHSRIELLASASHEIRTPMMGILGIGDLLLKRELPVEDKRSVETIRSSALALLGVLDDLLDYSRIEAGNLTLQSETFEIRQAVAGVVELLEPRAREKGLELISQVWQEAPQWVYGDPWRLRQVLINLVSNAIKFTREGRVILEVLPARQSVDSDEMTLRFAVLDTGMGVPESEIPKIFGPFIQGHQDAKSPSAADKMAGAGLGLAISRRIVDVMGGRIGADSQVGQGSNFWFEIPLRRVDEPDSAPTLTGMLTLFQTGRVLLAEDNEVNRTVILGQLQSLGVTTDVVFDGAQAIKAFAENHYDLVLMDCQMPVMNGFRAVRRIREQESERRVPVIAITAHAFEADRERCLKAGMDDILVKPFDEDQLASMLDRWLAGEKSAPVA